MPVAVVASRAARLAPAFPLHRAGFPLRPPGFPFGGAALPLHCASLDIHRVWRRHGRLHGFHGPGRRRFDNRDDRPALLQPEHLLLHAAYDLVVFFVVLEEIRDVEKRVPVQPDIHKSRLHARQDARYAALMDAPGQGIFVFALEINFDDLVVLEYRHLRLVAVGRNHQFL